MANQSNSNPNFIIYHNPRCSKSREGLAHLQANGIEPQVVSYMKTKFTVKEFDLLLAQLNMKPSELLRKGEKIFKSEYKALQLTEHEWKKVMLKHPELIERPIVVRGNKAVVGRPLENIDSLIKK